MKQILIILGVITVVGVGGGTFYVVNKNSVTEEIAVTPEIEQSQNSTETQSQPPAPQPQVETNAPIKQLTKVETITAKIFGEKILKLIQSKDYGKIWDLFTPESKKLITRGDYVKSLVESIGNYNISSYEVKDVIEEKDGASFQWLIRYSNNPFSPEETGIFNLAKRNGSWFLAYGDTTTYTTIEKRIGDTVELATLKFKINSSEERSVITSTYSESVSAKENSKFIFVDMTITNTTNTSTPSPFSDSFALIDNSNRQFKVYRDEPIVFGQDYLTARELAPGINERGWVVFEVPNDSTSYGIAIGKSGTNDIYKVILK